MATRLNGVFMNHGLTRFGFTIRRTGHRLPICFPKWHLSLAKVTGDSDERPGPLYNPPMPTKETLQVESRTGTAPQTRVIKVTGSLTLSSCFEFQDQLRADTSHCLILDMTDVRYVDSSGIGCLVNGYIAHHMAGGRMVLAGVNKRIRETLEETRVQQFFTFYDTVEEAEKQTVVRTS
jgi:anti-anti-sigma factor